MSTMRNPPVTRCADVSAVPTQRIRHDTTRPPLSGHQVLHTRDLVAAQSAVSGHLWPTRIQISDQGEFTLRLHHASFGVIGLAYLSCGDAAVSATLDARPDGDRALLVALPWVGTVECWYGRERTAVAGRTAMVIQPGRLTVTLWQPGAALLLVVLPERLVAETLGDLTSEPASAPPRFDLVQPGLAGWARLVRAICDIVDSGGPVDHPITTRYVQQALTAGLLTAARHDQSERIRATVPGVPSRRLRPAVDWIHTHYADPTIGVSDIARAAGLSLRTLFRALRQDTGMSPGEYLRRVRLLTARAALRAATPTDTTVTEVAGRAGFTDPSWFAIQYQRAYGERPVDTLRAGVTH